MKFMGSSLLKRVDCPVMQGFVFFKLYENRLEQCQSRFLASYRLQIQSPTVDLHYTYS